MSDGLVVATLCALAYSHVIAFWLGRLTAEQQPAGEPTWDDIVAQGDCGLFTEHQARITHKAAGNPTASADDRRAAI